MGDGAKAYIKFLNQAIIDTQRLFAIELNKEEQMELRVGISKAISEVVDKAEKRMYPSYEECVFCEYSIAGNPLCQRPKGMKCKLDKE